MLKILCFGDSISLGEKDIEQGGWVDRLKKDYFNYYLNHPTQEVNVYNLGIGGETTDGLCKRFEVEFNARRIKGQNTLLILNYGANDIVIHKQKNIVPENYFVRNLNTCISYAKANESKVLLLSLLPISELIEAKINQHGKLRFDQDIQKYNGLLKKMATDSSCDYLDVYTPFINFQKEKLLSGDGVHPNSEGHRVIYQLVKQKLLEISPIICK